MLGKYLKKYRLDNNMTQNELAEKLNTSQSYYSLIESGKCKPGIEMIKRISNELKLEPSFVRNLL